MKCVSISLSERFAVFLGNSWFPAVAIVIANSRVMVHSYIHCLSLKSLLGNFHFCLSVVFFFFFNVVYRKHRFGVFVFLSCAIRIYVLLFIHAMYGVCHSLRMIFHTHTRQETATERATGHATQSVIYK